MDGTRSAPMNLYFEASLPFFVPVQMGLAMASEHGAR
jgi:hypothetical protein